MKSSFLTASVMLVLSSLLPITASAQEQVNQVVPATDLGYERSIKLAGSGSQGSIALPIYSGLVPTELKFSLEASPNFSDGFITIKNRDTTLDTISFPFDEEQVVNLDETELEYFDELIIDFQATIEQKEEEIICSDYEEAWIEINDYRLELAGQLAKPASISEIFHPNVKQIIIQLEDQEVGTVTSAIVLAQAAQFYSEGKNVAVEIKNSTDEISEGNPSLVVATVGKGEQSEISLVNDGDWAKLEITGQGDQLVALTSQLLDTEKKKLMTRSIYRLADKASVPVTNQATELALHELGYDDINFAGVGSFSANLIISQTDFGFLADSGSAQIKGNYSATAPGSQARLDLIFNDELIDSQQLSAEGGSFDLAVDLPDGSLARENEVRLTANYITADGRCRSEEQPLLVTLDDSSTIKLGTINSQASSFNHFPQAWQRQLVVYLDQFSNSNIEVAAQMLALQQRTTDQPISVRVATQYLNDDKLLPKLYVLSSLETIAKQHPRVLETELYGEAERIFTNQDSSVIFTFTDETVPVLAAVADDSRNLESALAELVGEDGWFSMEGTLLSHDREKNTFAAIYGDLNRQYWASSPQILLTGLGIILLVGGITGLMVYRKKPRSRIEEEASDL